MAFADGLADRAVLLQEGSVLDTGPWADVRDAAAERGWR
jgi:ABC-2 type transport system ATP-binding protein